VDEVENLRKHHTNFEAKLLAQEERVNVFSAQADDLQKQKHPESDYIEKRRHSVLSARSAVKEHARQRRSMLNNALDYENFRRDADEVRFQFSYTNSHSISPF
jgi:hypothetical protein